MAAFDFEAGRWFDVDEGGNVLWLDENPSTQETDMGLDDLAQSSITGDSGSSGTASKGTPWLTSLLSGLGIPLTGNDALIGANAILGVLGALGREPEVGTKQTTETKTGTTTTEVGQPQWYEDLTQGLGTQISGANGSWSDLGGYMTGGTGSVAGADLSKYMNPYIDAVLQPQLTRMNEDFLRGENARRAKAGMLGAFGGDRDILEGSLATERYDKAVNEATANAFSNAFSNAQSMFGQDRAAQQWGAGMTGNLFGLLKPGQTTSVSATAGDTSTTMATGSKPNTAADLAGITAQWYQMLNPPISSNTTTKATPPVPVAATSPTIVLY